MKYELTDWMKNLSDSVSLFELNICGTHDCVTQYIAMPYIFRCQSTTVAEQLRAGIRALDIRAEVRDSRLKMVHAVMKAKNGLPQGGQLDMADILSQCYDFLKQNPSETIIFQYKNDSNKNYEQSFDILYNEYIAKDADYWYLENRLPSLGEARGKLVLLRRCKMAQNPEYTQQNSGVDFSSWVEQTQKTPKSLILTTKGKNSADFIIQDRYKYKPIQRWDDVIKPFLDGALPFNGKYIINYISTAGGLKGPYNNAVYINGKFLEYPLNKNNYYGTIYTDFPSERLIKKIIDLNF